jgi:hypothetical protein
MWNKSNRNRACPSALHNSAVYGTTANRLEWTMQK